MLSACAALPKMSLSTGSSSVVQAAMGSQQGEQGKQRFVVGRVWLFWLCHLSCVWCSAAQHVHAVHRIIYGGAAGCDGQPARRARCVMLLCYVAVTVVVMCACVCNDCFTWVVCELSVGCSAAQNVAVHGIIFCGAAGSDGQPARRAGCVIMTLVMCACSQ